MLAGESVLVNTASIPNREVSQGIHECNQHNELA